MASGGKPKAPRRGGRKSGPGPGDAGLHAFHGCRFNSFSGMKGDLVFQVRSGKPSIAREPCEEMVTPLHEADTQVNGLLTAEGWINNEGIDLGPNTPGTCAGGKISSSNFSMNISMKITWPERVRRADYLICTPAAFISLIANASSPGFKLTARHPAKITTTSKPARLQSRAVYFTV